MGIAFKVYVRCTNCRKDYGCRLEPPAADDAPADIDELLESQYLQEQRFTCRDCDCPIGAVTGVKLLVDDQVESVRILEPCS